jgi:hypothetical protein
VQAENMMFNQYVTLKQLSRQYRMLQCVGRNCGLTVVVSFLQKLSCVLHWVTPSFRQQSLLLYLESMWIICALLIGKID